MGIELEDRPELVSLYSRRHHSISVELGSQLICLLSTQHTVAEDAGYHDETWLSIGETKQGN